MASPKPSRGFTLLELVIALCVIGMLVALLLPALSKARESARAMMCLSQLRQIQYATMTYTSGIYIPPAQNETRTIYWDNILYNEGLISTRTLECPKAVRQAGTDYADVALGKIVNSRFRSTVPSASPDGTPAPNSNYVCNGGEQGGGTLDSLLLGIFATPSKHPFRCVISSINLNNPLYLPPLPLPLPPLPLPPISPLLPPLPPAPLPLPPVVYPLGTLLFNGYQAFDRPLKSEILRRPSGTIGYQDGGFQTGADFIAPRHGGRSSAEDPFATAGNNFQVSWFDGHCTAITRGPTLQSPWVGLNIKMWWINPDE